MYHLVKDRVLDGFDIASYGVGLVLQFRQSSPEGGAYGSDRDTLEALEESVILGLYYLRCGRYSQTLEGDLYGIAEGGLCKYARYVAVFLRIAEVNVLHIDRHVGYTDIIRTDIGLCCREHSRLQ